MIRRGDQVALFLDHRPEDGEQPVRRLYWFHFSERVGRWRAWFDGALVEGWMKTAVPAEFPGGDKPRWRLATRYAVVRLRQHPEPALGVAASVLGPMRWERVEA